MHGGVLLLDASSLIDAVSVFIQTLLMRTAPYSRCRGQSCYRDVALFDKANPTVQDWRDALRIVHYLNAAGTDVGLHFDASKFSSLQEALTPTVYVDADHCKVGDFKSRSGQVIFLCGAPVFWRSQLQHTIATSSTHAEVIALSDCCKRVVWLRTLLGELGFKPLPPIPVHEDNSACLQLSQNTATSDRTRHIDVRHWWTRELHEKGLVDLLPVGTKDNVADFFTKILTVQEQKRYIDRLVSSADS